MSNYKFPLTIICLALAGCNSENNTTTTPIPDTVYEYGTKSVYSARQDPQTYEAAPEGYTAVYTEMVARHGSRALSSRKYDDLSMQVWQLAEAENALTELGKSLGPELQRMMAVNDTLGYGNLSELGIKEHQNLAERVVARQAGMWDSAVINKQHVLFEHSKKDRAIDSAKNFADSFKSALPDLAPLVEEATANKAHLYFHKAEINQDYQDYIESDPELREKISALMQLPRSKAVAKTILERIYSSAFVERLAKGEFVLENTDEEGNKGGTFIRNEVDAALMLFNLYLISPGLHYEAGSEPWKFDRFITEQESVWLSYVMDGEDFYEKGPSFNDTEITYHMASVLVDDFFNEVEKVANGDHSDIAKFRFAHAETIIPFAAELKLEGSTLGVARDTLYSQSDNPWRGSWVAPYSANIQWDVYRDSAHGTLVTMYYNEKQIKFMADCVPYEKSDYYYQLDELKRCYNR